MSLARIFKIVSAVKELIFNFFVHNNRIRKAVNIQKYSLPSADSKCEFEYIKTHLSRRIKNTIFLFQWKTNKANKKSKEKDKGMKNKWNLG